MEGCSLIEFATSLKQEQRADRTAQIQAERENFKAQRQAGKDKIGAECLTIDAERQAEKEKIKADERRAAADELRLLEEKDCLLSEQT